MDSTDGQSMQSQSMQSQSMQSQSMQSQSMYHPYDPYYYEDALTSELRMWCLDEQSNPILFRVIGAPIFSTWILPDNINWSIPSYRQALIKAFEYKFRKKDVDFKSLNICPTTPLCYHDPKRVNGTDRRPFYILIVQTKTQKELYRVGNMMRYSVTITLNRTKYPVKVGKCDPRINLDWKIMCGIGKEGLEYCQWFTITRCYPPTQPVSKIREYFIHVNEIIPVQSDKVTHPVTMSFDIECFSNTPNAFPQEHKIKDIAYLITTSTKRVGTNEPTKRVAILFGDCDERLALSSVDERASTIKSEACERDEASDESKEETPVLQNTTLIKVSTEAELMREFEKVIIQENPIVITGYNIAGFDWKYLDGRMCVLDIDWSNFSLMKNHDVTMSTISWGSSAYGSVNLYFPDCPGRICFDVMDHVKRNYKLQNYRLNTVAAKFLGKKKLDVSAKEMFAAVRAQQANEPGHIEKMSRVVKYGILDADLPIELFEHHNMWVASVQMSNVVKIPMKLLNMSGQQRRIAALIYKKCKQKGYTMNEKIMGASGYKGGHVADPVQGMHKNVVVLDFASLYPSIMFMFNLSYDTLVPPDQVQWIREEHKKYYHFINIKKIDGEKEDEDERVEACDKAEETKGAREAKDPKQLEDESQEEEPQEDELHVFFRGRVGIIPQIISELLSERKRVKKMMKTKGIDPMRKVVLNARQLALKVCCNSIYGFTGASVEMGILPLLPIAKCTTFLGRDSIIRTNNYIIDTWPGTKIVYNDTDSTMFTVDRSVSGAPQFDNYTTFGLMVGEETSRYLKVYYVGEEDTEKRKGVTGMLDLEFEELVDLMFCIKKKMYVKAYNKKDDEGNDMGVIDFDTMKFKGIMLARRNASNFTRNIYRKILTMIMSGCSYNEVLCQMVKFIVMCRSRGVNICDLLENQGMGGNYKQKTYFMNMFSQNLAEVGKVVKAGERLDYVVLESVNGKVIQRESGKRYKGDKMRLMEQIDDMIRDDTDFTLDTNYYSCAGGDNIDTIFGIAFIDAIRKVNDVAKERVMRLHEGDENRIRILRNANYPDFRIRTSSYFTRVNKQPMKNINKIAKLKAKYVADIEEFDRRCLRSRWGMCVLRMECVVDGAFDWKSWVDGGRGRM